MKDKITPKLTEDQIKEEIRALPPGNIAIKKIKGKEYHYYRYCKNGKRYEKCMKGEELALLSAQIAKRKSLESELDLLERRSNGKDDRGKTFEGGLEVAARLGDDLLRWAKMASSFKPRECFGTLLNYLEADCDGKVFILYGLRRTGKTTMIRQAILSLAAKCLDRIAFLQVTSGDDLSSINSSLRHLEKSGYKYVFIDEVTLADDFISGAALFSDIFASSGMKIVLSGTDSLGFLLAEDDQLYDRCYLLHTTFISYREFEDVLGIHGIDEFLRFGGTMSVSGALYNQQSSFANEKKANEYVNSAIAKNILHSLKCYQDGGHFRSLYELYEKGELVNVINRVVNDINHRFSLEVLTAEFKASLLSEAEGNLLHDRETPIDLKKNIQQDEVVCAIKTMLEILEKDEQSVPLDENIVCQIEEYLTLLDLLDQVDQLHFPSLASFTKRTLITQPGLRYAQVEATVLALLNDEKFNELSSSTRNKVIDRVMKTAEGRMMEDQILLETKLAFKDRKVFQLLFAVGEFDMVVWNEKESTCEIYEIKHSEKIIPGQYRHLIDEEKCAKTERRFGKIKGKYVIYRGSAGESEGIRYLNCEDYLKSLPKQKA